MRRAAAFAIVLLTGVALVGAAPCLLKQSSDWISLSKTEPLTAFEQWAVAHDKPYVGKVDTQEHSQRMSTFLDNIKLLEELQVQNPNVQLRLNDFSDLSWEEFSSTRLGYRPDVRPAGLRDVQPIEPFMYAETEIKQAVDWVAKGAVTGVKNQGSCGSCWAFATTGAIEGANAIHSGELVVLSEQELVDCDVEKNMGCGGGLMNYAYEYVIQNGGIDTEEDYSYWSGWGMSLWGCNSRKEADRTVVSIDGYQEVPADEESLLKAATNQPISVGICASSAMMFYHSGVLDSCCKGLNHGVLVTGYGTDEANGEKYYLVKNSWGEAWGEEGFFRLRVNGIQGDKEGLCGIASAASFPVKTTANHPVPEVCDIFAWTECPHGNTCSCSFSLFGMLCLWHDCCPLADGVTCADLQHCCPADAPICDGERGLCVSEDGQKSVDWTAKAKAVVAGRAQDEQPVGSGCHHAQEIMMMDEEQQEEQEKQEQHAFEHDSKFARGVHIGRNPAA